MSRARRSITTAVLSFVLIASLSAGAAMAGRTKNGNQGGRPADSTLTLVVVDPEGGEPTHGGKVTFEVSTTVTDQPSVALECAQGGVLVYNGSAGFYPEYPWRWAQTFTLSSDVWTGGPAECTATMYHFDGRRYRDITSIAFHANG